MSFLGIDIGTSGVKAAAMNREGRFISFAHENYPLLNRVEGRYELSPDQVWQATERVVSYICCQTQADPIEAICVSSLGESCVLLDADDRVLADSPMYYDLRGDEETARLETLFSRKTWLQNVGLLPHRQQSLPKLMWIEKHAPGITGKTRHIQFFADFILHRFGAPYVTEPSLAATSMMLDYRNEAWWPGATDCLRQLSQALPKICPSGSVVGTVDPLIADRLGLRRDVRLVLGGHDQMMCAVGCGALDRDIAANSMGTSDAITPLIRGTENADMIFDAGFRMVPFSVKSGVYASSIYNLNGGELLKWYLKCFGNGANDAGYAHMEESMPDEPTGVVFMPHFNGRQDDSGNRTRGAVLGLDYACTRESLYRSVLEGQAYELRLWMERFESHSGAIRSLHVTGGGGRSDRNLQLRADIFGKKICRMKNVEAGILGNAMTAGCAVGAFTTLEEAASASVFIDDVFEPNTAMHERYGEAFENYKRYYDTLG